MVFAGVVKIELTGMALQKKILDETNMPYYIY